VTELAAERVAAPGTPEESSLFFLLLLLGKATSSFFAAKGSGGQSSAKQLVRVTGNFTVSSAAFRTVLNKCSITSGSPRIKCNAGKGPCRRVTFAAFLCCTKLAEPQPQLGTYLQGKCMKRPEPEPPWLPRELSRSRVPNAEALPSPSLSRLPVLLALYTNPHRLSFAWIQATLPTKAKVHTDKTSHQFGRPTSAGPCCPAVLT